MAITLPKPPRKIQKSTPVFKDPYLPWGEKNGAVCRMCRSIYHHKRWYLEGEVSLGKAEKSRMSLAICPQGEFVKRGRKSILLVMKGGIYAYR